MDSLDHQKYKQMDSRANSVCNVTDGKHDKTEAVHPPVHHEKAGFFWKDNNAGEKKRQQEKRKSNYDTA